MTSGIIAVGSGCNKAEKERHNSDCLEAEINRYRIMSYCADAKVDQYSFQGETVYVFEPGTCGADMSAPVMDSKCNVIGHLGGFSGNGQIKGENFSNATFIKTVWTK